MFSECSESLRLLAIAFLSKLFYQIYHEVKVNSEHKLQVYTRMPQRESLYCFYECAITIPKYSPQGR